MGQAGAIRAAGKSASNGNKPTLWEVDTGKELRSFGRQRCCFGSVAFSPDGRFAITGNSHGPISFSHDGRFVLSGSSDGPIRIWDVETQQERARMLATSDGEWLAMTPEDFFSSSHRDTDMLAIVRGVETTKIGQVYHSLFNPDLVRETLTSDPGPEFKRAAEAVNLEKVLDSGPPPAIVITSHAPGRRSGADLATVTARITDGGKGIGRIEWRVNGITAGVMSSPAGPGPNHDVKRTLSLDPGKNRIEVIVYERRNLLASLPVRTTISSDVAPDAAKPQLTS